MQKEASYENIIQKAPSYENMIQNGDFMRNQIMLITYPDSMGKNLTELHEALSTYFDGAFGSVHLLPFFPSSADRGFAPIRYDRVEQAFGTYEDIRALADKYPLMFDFMVNHISAHSEYYLDFQKKKEASLYKNMFIRYKDFWKNGEPTEEQVDMIYKRKPRAPYVTLTFSDQTTEKIWCTFGDEQIDLAVDKEETTQFIRGTFAMMKENGASIIRLDAFAYAVKKPDTNCFFVEPEIWELLYRIQDIASEYGLEILPEIHEHYSIQMKLADKGFMVYDFALPMLLLHSLYTHNGKRLKEWLDICPRNQMTTLDTHDGIGVVDVHDLLTPEEIDETKELLYRHGANVKKIYSSEAYNNLDIYQINCTYYSALGNNDKAYLLARAIQFFAPGIPQVYYVGALAGANDIALLEQTKEGRNINRHYYTLDEIKNETKRPVVKQLLDLMRLRNTHPAFDGTCSCSCNDDKLTITREHEGARLTLHADLTNYQFEII